MNLLLFLGAGASVPSNLPVARDLTNKLFVPHIGESAVDGRVRSLLTVIKEYDTADIGLVAGPPYPGAIYRSSVSTYEDLYFLSQQITLWNIGLSDNSLTTPFMERVAEKASGLLVGSSMSEKISDLAKIGRLMTSYIERVVTETLRQQYITGFDLVRELSGRVAIEQLNIVTLNHDTLVEQFLTANAISFADGFGDRDGDVRWSDDHVYDDPTARVRLFKLHGSVNWYAFQREGRLRTAIFLGDDIGVAKDKAGQQLKSEYRTPSFLSGINKSDAYQRGIYADMHFRFYDLLRQNNQILMSGYGWGDTALNFRLDAWLDNSRSNKIVLLQEDPEGLTGRSLVFAEGYNGWSRSGQLVCLDQWLCNTALSDLRGLLSGPL